MSPRSILLFCAAVLIASSVLVTPPAAAQTIDSPYRFIEGRHEAGAFVAHVPGNRGTMELAPGGGTLVGGRYGLDLSGPFALEFGAWVLPTDRRVRVPNSEGDAIDELGTADATVAGAEGQLRFTLTGDRTWHRMAPFVAAGGGVARNFSGRIEEEAELTGDVRATFGPTFVGILGAGARVFLSDQLVLRAEASARYWKQGTPEGFRVLDPEQVGPVVDQEWPVVSGFSVGLSWRF
jgi:hypothetical protein